MKSLSKLLFRTPVVSKNLLATSIRASFHTSKINYNKKLGIGEATAALEEKISKIS